MGPQLHGEQVQSGLVQEVGAIPQSQVGPQVHGEQEHLGFRQVVGAVIDQFCHG